MATHPKLLVRRGEQLELLARALRAAGVTPVEPIGGHAVYVPIAADQANSNEGCRGIEALLFRLTGIRSRINPSPVLGRKVLRLALAIARYDDRQLVDAGRMIGAVLGRLAESPRLHEQKGTSIHDMYVRFEAPQS